MKLTPKIQKAINLASQLHAGQTRKTSQLPYISHLVSVAFIIANYTDNEDIICAGLLHDVLEDVSGYSFVELEKDFNLNIARIVKELTEDKKPTDSKQKNRQTWRYRKEKYIQNLKTNSQEALLVSAADKIHNLNSIIEAYQQKGEAVWQVFNAPEPKKENSIWFYEEVFKVLEKRLNNEIVKEYQKTLLAAKNIFGLANDFK